MSGLLKPFECLAFAVLRKAKNTQGKIQDISHTLVQPR